MPPPLSEHQLEEILAAYPDDFFPHREFRLVGRQTSFAGVGRFDLLFEDGAGRKWLIELKAVPLKITDTDQVMRYHEELHTRAPEDLVIPCFVAPVIPPHVRSYLDGKGIEYREFTHAEFHRVAAAHGSPEVAVEDDLADIGGGDSTASADPAEPGRQRVGPTRGEGAKVLYHADDFSPPIEDGEVVRRRWRDGPSGPMDQEFIFHVDPVTKIVSLSSPQDSTHGQRRYQYWRDLIVHELKMGTWRQNTSVLRVKDRHERRRDERAAGR